MAENVLITGATAGLGAEFADQIAAKGSNLILVARNESRLDGKAAQLRAKHSVHVESLSADLHTDDGIDRVVARLKENAVPVTTLINNAGYGLTKPFADNPIETELDHLKIHVEVPLTLSHAALQGMRERRSGNIINVSSVAGFTPRGSYGAVKAAMISFSRWANIAYSREGVNVMALCPGFVHTEFHQRMKVDKKTVPSWMWLHADDVVAEGLRDAARGKAVSIPSAKYKVLVGLSRLLPPEFVASVAKRGR